MQVGHIGPFYIKVYWSEKSPTPSTLKGGICMSKLENKNLEVEVQDDKKEEKGQYDRQYRNHCDTCHTNRANARPSKGYGKRSSGYPARNSRTR